jgi:hypothetical protein
MAPAPALRVSSSHPTSGMWCPACCPCTGQDSQCRRHPIIPAYAGLSFRPISKPRRRTVNLRSGSTEAPPPLYRHPPSCMLMRHQPTLLPRFGGLYSANQQAATITVIVKSMPCSPQNSIMLARLRRDASSGAASLHSGFVSIGTRRQIGLCRSDRINHHAVAEVALRLFSVHTTYRRV